jgi:S-adenosylmethionine decarboxylase
MPSGRHLLIDCRDAEWNVCVDDDRMLTALADAARDSGATVISQVRYRFGETSPPGFAVVVLLDESHCSAHSYAESGQIAIDIFTCGAIDPWAILTKIRQQVNLGQINTKEMPRFTTGTDESSPESHASTYAPSKLP